MSVAPATSGAEGHNDGMAITPNEGGSMNDYYAERRAAVSAMYPRTGRPYSWTDPDGIRWTLDADGRRFAFVGDYTVRKGTRTAGYSVLRDIDGDEVRVATGLTLDEATALARGNA